MTDRNLKACLMRDAAPEMFEALRLGTPWISDLSIRAVAIAAFRLAGGVYDEALDAKEHRIKDVLKLLLPGTTPDIEKLVKEAVAQHYCRGSSQREEIERAARYVAERLTSSFVIHRIDGAKNAPAEGEDEASRHARDLDNDAIRMQWEMITKLRAEADALRADIDRLIHSKTPKCDRHAGSSGVLDETCVPCLLIERNRLAAENARLVEEVRLLKLFGGAS